MVTPKHLPAAEIAPTTRIERVEAILEAINLVDFRRVNFKASAAH